MVKTLLLEPFYAACGKSTEYNMAAAKEINDMDGPATANERMTQN